MNTESHFSPDPLNAGTPSLERRMQAVNAKLFFGLSPISLALASTDWWLNLLSSPGAQQRLQKDGTAVRVIDLSRTAGQAAAPASSPASAPGAVASVSRADAPSSSPALAQTAPVKPAAVSGPNPCLKG